MGPRANSAPHYRSGRVHNQQQGRPPSGCAATRDIFHRALHHDAGRSPRPWGCCPDSGPGRRRGRCFSAPVGLLAGRPSCGRWALPPFRGRGAVVRAVLRVMPGLQRGVSPARWLCGQFCKRSGVLKGIPPLCQCYNVCKVWYRCENRPRRARTARDRPAGSGRHGQQTPLRAPRPPGHRELHWVRLAPIGAGY